MILIAGLERAPGELSFEARIGPEPRQVWFRTETVTLPASEAALAACLLPAMRLGDSLELEEPLDPRLLRSQREFQAIQRARSTGWGFGDLPLGEVEVIAPTRVVRPEPPSGRMAAIVDGGADSWATVLGEPDLTDVIFVDGFDPAARAEGAPRARTRRGCARPPRRSACRSTWSAPTCVSCRTRWSPGRSTPAAPRSRSPSSSSRSSTGS